MYLKPLQSPCIQQIQPHFQFLNFSLQNSLISRNFEQVYFWKISFKFYVTFFIKPFNRENQKQTNRIKTKKSGKSRPRRRSQKRSKTEQNEDQEDDEDGNSRPCPCQGRGTIGSRLNQTHHSEDVSHKMGWRCRPLVL